ncbi:MAG TPA: glycosyltransferase family 39 protein, partial [Haliangium sp.]|nr:glycosyltransferase family 39 protein [Haliangium sp.]
LRAAVGVALAIAACAWAHVAQRQVGLARDEVVYMHHGTRYADWWIGLASGEPDMLTDDAITRHFGGPGATDGNREHPPLMKTLFGLSERLVHRKLQWTDRTSAYRLPSAVMHGVLIALMYWFAASLWGEAVGLLAALLLLLMPRGLFHAGLATFDGAVVTMWVAVLFSYWRALGSRRWCLGLGIVYGLALATKHNALLLPAALVPHYLWVSFQRGRALAGDQAGAPAGDQASPASRGRRVRRWLGWIWRGALAQRPLMFPALCVLGPLVLIALWPWLWFETFGHAAAWVRFHLQHVHYNFEYLGTNWNAPPYPWHVPVVTTLLTVPVVTTLAALLGGGALALARRSTWAAAAAPASSAAPRASGAPDGDTSGRAPMLLLLLSAAVAMGPFLVGRAPIFGAEKHWAAAMFTLCILAALGVAAAGRLAVHAMVMAGRLAEARARAARFLAIALLGAAVLVAAAIETVRAQPYALSYYNALAGGAPGGADLGMNRQFWGYSVRGVLPYLNTLAPAPGQPARAVYTHDASPAWPIYRSEKLVAPGLPDAGHERQGVGRSTIALVIHERHFNRHDYMIWDDYGTVQPAHVLTFQGVPIVSVYVREQ